jgi:hypothetical protein
MKNVKARSVDQLQIVAKAAKLGVSVQIEGEHYRCAGGMAHAAQDKQQART